MLKTNPNILEINLKNIEFNINQIQKKAGKNKILMPIIKAKAYGSGLNILSNFVKKFSIVGVAIIDEAIELRKVGYQGEILILNPITKEETNIIMKNNLIPSISSFKSLKILNQISTKTQNIVKFHLEIDTGMTRYGINLVDLEKYIKYIKKNKNLKLSGVYTHFSCSDSDENYTNFQFQKFNKAVKQIKEQISEISFFHCSNSGAIINQIYTNEDINMIRPGLMLYGYYPNKSLKNKINLKPALILKSKINHIKNVKENTNVGYNKSYITTKKSKIAIIPIGYADGINRMLSNKGFVIIKKQKCPIIGNVCMDSLMVDITAIKAVKEEDSVYLFDNKIITIEDIAELCGTINYEIISQIGSRVRREFK